MRILFKDLEKVSNSNDGTWGTFYYKNKKYDGVVYDIIDDKIYWIFEVKDGLQNGLEITYYEGTDVIHQKVEYKDNFQYGLSKEYNEQGELQFISIVYDNDYLEITQIEDGKFKKLETYDKKRHENGLPSYIEYLLSLSNEELVNYEFKADNPNLIF